MGDRHLRGDPQGDGVLPRGPDHEGSDLAPRAQPPSPGPVRVGRRVHDPGGGECPADGRGQVMGGVRGVFDELDASHASVSPGPAAGAMFARRASRP